MTYVEEVRDRLTKMKKPELEDLALKVFGSKLPGLKNNEARIAHIMTKSRRAARLLGIRLSWWERYHNHIYGVVGILSTVFAIYTWINPTSIATKLSAPIDPLRKQEVFDKVARIQGSPQPVGFEEPPSKREVLDTVPEPTNDGFELIRSSIVCDLRSYQKVSSVNQREKLSPVVQDVNHTIKNITGATEYRLWSHTSGLDVYAQSITHPDRLTVYASEERRTVANYLVRPRILAFDVSDDPKNREFTIQVSKTFWNAFQNPDQSWVGVVVGLPTRNIEYLIIFPEDKPFTSYEFFANDAEKNRIDLPAQTYVLEDPRKRWLWWNIVNPVPGNGYNVDWEW